MEIQMLLQESSSTKNREKIILQMPLSDISDMTPTSFAAPRTGKIIKKMKEEKICYKMVYYTLYLT